MKKDSVDCSSGIFPKNRSRLIRMNAAIGALLIAGSLSYKHSKSNTFIVEDRNLSTYNIYSGDTLLISGEEYERALTDLEAKIDLTITDENADDILILDAVSKNSNLQDDQKKLLYSFARMIDDNPYINKEAAYRSLLNVMVLYKDRPSYYKNNVEGVYTEKNEVIGIFEDDPELRVLIHEFIHCIYSNSDTKELPLFISEGVTELLTNEYFSDTPFVELANYPFDVVAVKMLCDVVSPEIVLETYSTGNMDLIYDALGDYVDRDTAVKAIEMLDFSLRNYEDKLKKDEKPIDEIGLKADEYLPTKVFDTCINKKYADDSNEKLSYYYNQLLFMSIFDKNTYYTYIDTLTDVGMLGRAYFSKELVDNPSIGLEGIHSGNTEKVFKREYGRVK